MLIRLHSAFDKKPLLLSAERISTIKETCYMNYATGEKKYVGSEIMMNDCEYTKEGHKKKIIINVSESVDEIYNMIQNV